MSGTTASRCIPRVVHKTQRYIRDAATTNAGKHLPCRERNGTVQIMRGAKNGAWCSHWRGGLDRYLFSSITCCHTLDTSQMHKQSDTQNAAERNRQSICLGIRAYSFLTQTKRQTLLKSCHLVGRWTVKLETNRQIPHKAIKWPTAGPCNNRYIVNWVDYATQTQTQK